MAFEVDFSTRPHWRYFDPERGIEASQRGGTYGERRVHFHRMGKPDEVLGGAIRWRHLPREMSSDDVAKFHKKKCGAFYVHWDSSSGFPADVDSFDFNEALLENPVLR